MAKSLKRDARWIEYFRFETVQRSLHVYRRAKRMRMVFVVIVLAVPAARLAIPDTTSDVLSMPVVMGVMFFLSFFTFAAERATRWQYADSLDRYESLIEN